MDRSHPRYRELVHKDVSENILKAFFKSHSILGYGYLESVYQRAMPIALKRLGLSSEREVPIKIYFLDECVGEYRADLIVEGKVLVEVKSCAHIAPVHDMQIFNYLKASNLEVGLLLNFGPNETFQRYVNSKNRNKE